MNAGGRAANWSWCIWVTGRNHDGLAPGVWSTRLTVVASMPAYCWKAAITAPGSLIRSGSTPTLTTSPCPWSTVPSLPRMGARSGQCNTLANFLSEASWGCRVSGVHETFQRRPGRTRRSVAW